MSLFSKILPGQSSKSPVFSVDFADLTSCGFTSCGSVIAGGGLDHLPEGKVVQNSNGAMSDPQVDGRT